MVFGDLSNDEEASLEPSRMPLRQHLEELRTRLILCFLVLVGLFFASLFFSDQMLAFLYIPWDQARDGILAMKNYDIGVLKNIKPHEPLVLTIKLSLYSSILAGAPFYFWQIWCFVRSGLVDRERHALSRSFPFALGLFGAGLSFGYFVLLPMGLQFMLTFYEPTQVEPAVTLGEYFKLASALTLLMGFVFELPLVMWMLVRLGIVEHETLASSRRVAVIGILVFGAVMTPPDPVTQVLVAGPMYILYEVGLMLAARAEAARDVDL